MGGSFCWEGLGGAREVGSAGSRSGKIVFLKVAMCCAVIQSHGEPLRTRPTQIVTKSLVVFCCVCGMHEHCVFASDGSKESEE